MLLHLLQETPYVSIYDDPDNGWLFVDWRGDLSLSDVQHGCLLISQCLLTHRRERVLNSNCEVEQMAAKVLPWLANVFLPQAPVAGVHYIAWMCASHLATKQLAGEAIKDLEAPAIALFDHLADGYDWLQRTDFHFPVASVADEATRAVELHRRVEQMTEELAYYDRQRLARLGGAAPPAAA